ncbi:hypothetical protein ABEB36_010074 [Hypothenemus hampei]|uniref:Zinc phosphodiesterase ELAC protein 2 n=1 Tax=Hypothenemus hampei TaxID=57062 RepID=A0ABD1EIF1_HYPHA
MPKEPKHIAEAQKQRIRIKQKSANYVPGKVTLQVLGTGAQGAPRSVYMFSDQNRYLFNCGEGTQRLAHEHKTKLAKLEHIFVTQAVWRNIGGLPGTALTIQDVGVPQITLHGPEGLKDIFPATKRFVVLRDLKISMAECNENTVFEDSVMTVKYVLLKKGEMAKSVQVGIEKCEVGTSTNNPRRRRKRSLSQTQALIESDDTDYYAHERKRSKKPYKRRQSRSRSPTFNESGKRTSNGHESLQALTLPPTDLREASASVCFICRLQPRPGALDLDKCVRKGVPAGPLLGKLKNGEDVILEDGTQVKSSDVREPDDAGPVFIVVDCPDEEYLASLINNEELKKHQKFAKIDEDMAHVVVHFTPIKIMEHTEYRKWMDNFSPSTEHILVNEHNSCMGSVAVHRIQHKLNLLSMEIFPLLGDQGSPVLETIDGRQCKKFKTEIDLQNLKLDNASALLETDNNTWRQIGSLASYHLRPKKGFDSSSSVRLDLDEFVNETTSLTDFPAALKELQESLSLAKSNLTISDYPRIIFLGTGSCIPNKTRNTSGILLQISDSKNILLDCGEGTCGQILRFFGSTKGDQILTNIDAIYISHLHADHHIGLIGLLQGRRQALDRLDIDKEPLYLFAPKQILAWLNFYDKCFESIMDEFILIPNSDLLLDQTTFKKKEEVLNSLGLSNMNTCLVKHCPNAFGVALQDKIGYKITYSGDTMPSDNLIELGQNSHVLIHEATMEDELATEAVYKMHSTTSQAIEVGRLMQARHVILTHFSQRYAKLPRFNDNFADNVCIAFDNMQVRVEELPLIPLFYPALKIMFAEHYEELEHKAVKRQLKSERQASLERKVVKNT